MISNMFIPGQIENWMVLCDMGKNGIGNLSISSLKQVLGILQVNYRCRLGNNFVVNPPKSIWVLWSCIKPFLDETTIEKIKFSNNSVSQDLLSVFNPYQIEEKYGGKAKNCSNYWPPIVPDSPFVIQGKPNLLSDDKDTYFQYHQQEIYELPKKKGKKPKVNHEKLEIPVKKREKNENEVNSAEIEPEIPEISLSDINEDGYARSEYGEIEENLVDFEEAMPFNKNNERNPLFLEFSKRSSQEFQRSLSLKKQKIIKDNNENPNASEESLQENSNGLVFDHEVKAYCGFDFCCRPLKNCCII